MPDATSSPAARIEISRPKVFTVGALLAVHTYGLFLALPILVAMVLMSLLAWGPLSIVLLLGAVGLSIWFLPFGQGNLHVTRLVRSFCPEARAQENGFVVQLTLSPRSRTGLLAVLEDADDIGFLSFTDSAIDFHGDSVRFSIPYACVQQVRPHNVGMRGVFVYGRRIEVVLQDLPEARSLALAERSSLVLNSSRRTTRRLYDTFREHADRAKR